LKIDNFIFKIMKVIFLADVPNVGKKDEVKNVSDGYAVNFLLPRHLAIAASDTAVNELETRRRKITNDAERDLREQKSLVVIAFGDLFASSCRLVPCLFEHVIS